MKIERCKCNEPTTTVRVSGGGQNTITTPHLPRGEKGKSNPGQHGDTLPPLVSGGCGSAVMLSQKNCVDVLGVVWYNKKCPGGQESNSFPQIYDKRKEKNHEKPKNNRGNTGHRRTGKH